VLALLAAVPLLAAPAARAALPQIDYTLNGAPGASGWFTGPVTVKWVVSGETSADAGCLTHTLTADTPGVQLTCTASNADGAASATTKVIKIDQAAPINVTAVPARPPDRAPWYTAPLPLAWSGSDGTSGVAACTTTTYAGPDGAAVAPAGTCRDVAGNVGAAVPFPMAYDATPPVLAELAATIAGRTATVRWSAAADAQQVVVVRRPGDAGAVARTVLDGPATTREIADGPLVPGIGYTWTTTVGDAAGNTTSATAGATVPPPASPGQAAAKSKATKKTGPTLRWRTRRGAKYYNLQLFRGGRKILSAWPTKPHYTLKATWRYRGRRITLGAARYAWYVWPGYGPRAQRRYGRLLARGRVTVPKS
jgi:hypothetical protein